jgi:hypothetical protein
MLVLGVVTCNRTEPNSTSEARTLIALTAPKVASSYIHSKIITHQKESKQMHLLHHQDQGSEEGKGHQEHCSVCGRQLMERKGLLHRLTPISNAFVLNGYCLCHSDITDAQQLRPNSSNAPAAVQHDATPQTAPQE